MKVVIKKSKISAALVKQLEAAGIVVTLIISSAAGAQGIERGNLKVAINTSVADVKSACVEFHKAEAAAMWVEQSELITYIEGETLMDVVEVCGE